MSDLVGVQTDFTSLLRQNSIASGPFAISENADKHSLPLPNGNTGRLAL